MTQSRCIVNFACPGREQYLLGQERLKRSLKEVGYEGDLLFYRNTYPQGCPDHTSVPYAFKYYALRESRDAGHQFSLWLDASVVVKKHLDPIWGYIERTGVLLFRNPGCLESQFTSQDCLQRLKCDMDRAWKLEQCCGGVVGFNWAHPRACEVFDRMWELCNDGMSFAGRSGSTEPKFQSHRHDQSCLTVVADDLGVPKLPQEWLCYKGAKAEAEAFMVLEAMI